MPEMENVPKPTLPWSWRKRIYAGSWVTALVVGSLTVGFAAAGVASPLWFVVASAVWTFLHGQISGLAFANPPAEGEGEAPRRSDEGVFVEGDPDEIIAKLEAGEEALAPSPALGFHLR